MEVKVSGVEVERVLSAVLRFTEPNNFLPASDLVIFDRIYIITTMVWGGCVHLSSFFKTEKPLGLPVDLLKRVRAGLEGRLDKEVTIILDEVAEDISFRVGRDRSVVRAQTALKYTTPDRIKSDDVVLYEATGDVVGDLQKLLFSCSDNPYDVKFNGVWWSENDHAWYASDNFRITRFPSKCKLGLEGNFFVPSTFIEKSGGSTDKLEFVGLDENSCLFFFKDYITSFLVMEHKMPPFASAFAGAREEALSSEQRFTINMPKEDVARYRKTFREAGSAPDINIYKRDDGVYMLDAQYKHTQTGSFETEVDLVDVSGEIAFTIDGTFLLDALERFSTFYLVEKKHIYAKNEESGMEQLIAWKIRG